MPFLLCKLTLPPCANVINQSTKPAGVSLAISPIAKTISFHFRKKHLAEWLRCAHFP